MHLLSGAGLEYMKKLKVIESASSSAQRICQVCFEQNGVNDVPATPGLGRQPSRSPSSDAY